MKAFLLFREAAGLKEGMPDERAYRTISDPRFIDMPRCTACKKPIHPRDLGAVAYRCPNCKRGVIIRCSKCRKAGNRARCPVCGYEFP